MFDTFDDRGAAQRLADWIAGLAPDTIVAGAVRDEASRLLTEEAVRALGGLGVKGDLRGHFREAHAFVGVKAAPVGSALEALGPHPIVLTVGSSQPGFELAHFALTADETTPSGKR